MFKYYFLIFLNFWLSLPYKYRISLQSQYQMNIVNVGSCQSRSKCGMIHYLQITQIIHFWKIVFVKYYCKHITTWRYVISHQFFGKWLLCSTTILATLFFQRLLFWNFIFFLDILFFFNFFFFWNFYFSPFT